MHANAKVVKTQHARPVLWKPFVIISLEGVNSHTKVTLCYKKQTATLKLRGTVTVTLNITFLCLIKQTGAKRLEISVAVSQFILDRPTQNHNKWPKRVRGLPDWFNYTFLDALFLLLCFFWSQTWTIQTEQIEIQQFRQSWNLHYCSKDWGLSKIKHI